MIYDYDWVPHPDEVEEVKAVIEGLELAVKGLGSVSLPPNEAISPGKAADSSCSPSIAPKSGWLQEDSARSLSSDLTKGRRHRRELGTERD